MYELYIRIPLVNTYEGCIHFSQQFIIHFNQIRDLNLSRTSMQSLQFKVAQLVLKLLSPLIVSSRLQTGNLYLQTQNIF